MCVAMIPLYLCYSLNITVTAAVAVAVPSATTTAVVEAVAATVVQLKSAAVEAVVQLTATRSTTSQRKQVNCSQLLNETNYNSSMNALVVEC